MLSFFGCFLITYTLIFVENIFQYSPLKSSFWDTFGLGMTLPSKRIASLVGIKIYILNILQLECYILFSILLWKSPEKWCFLTLGK